MKLYTKDVDTFDGNVIHVDSKVNQSIYLELSDGQVFTIREESQGNKQVLCLSALACVVDNIEQWASLHIKPQAGNSINLIAEV